MLARDGLEYARRHGCGSIEASAREMVNIDDTFASMSLCQPSACEIAPDMPVLVCRVVDARQMQYQRPSRAEAVPTAAAPVLTAEASVSLTDKLRTKINGRMAVMRLGQGGVQAESRRLESGFTSGARRVWRRVVSRLRSF